MIRATKVDVLAHVKASLIADAAAAAGANGLLSKAEQANLPDGLVKTAAGWVREDGGAGTRVEVDALVAKASRRVATLLGRVNQRSGPGAAVVSMQEVRALHALDSDAGARVARAYELITGKTVTFTAPDVPSTGQLTAGRIALIAARARDVAGYNDMNTGEIPVGRAFLELPVLRGDPAANGRTYTVYVPLDGNTDPNAVEVLWLHSVDAQGIERTTTFEVPALSAASVLTALEPSLGTETPRVRGEIEVFNESGDNGVNTFANALPGAADLDGAIAQAQALWSSSWGFSSWGMNADGATGAQAVDRFLTAARDLYAEEDLDPADVDGIIEVFAERVQQTFANLEDVRLVTGPTVNFERGGTYLFGKTTDGWVALAVRQYRD